VCWVYDLVCRVVRSYRRWKYQEMYFRGYLKICWFYIWHNHRQYSHHASLWYILRSYRFKYFTNLHFSQIFKSYWYIMTKFVGWHDLKDRGVTTSHLPPPYFSNKQGTRHNWGQAEKQGHQAASLGLVKDDRHKIKHDTLSVYDKASSGMTAFLWKLLMQLIGLHLTHH
jgi:hypothetical protein